MSDIPWTMEASLYVGDRLYARGSLAELAFLAGDFPPGELKTAHILGVDLPIMYEGQRPHMMERPGVAILRQQYLDESPAHR